MHIIIICGPANLPFLSISSSGTIKRLADNQASSQRKQQNG